MVVYIPTILIICATAYFFLVWGYRIQNFLLLFAGSLLCIGVAIYTSYMGVQDWNNFVTVFFSGANAMVGFYFLLAGAYELVLNRNL